jgi:hypothetical protein
MDERTGRKAFAVAYLGVFVLAMWVTTGFSMDIVTAASAPIVLTAEAIVFGMIYATTFFDANHEHPTHIEAIKKAANAMQRHESSRSAL